MSKQDVALAGGPSADRPSAAFQAPALAPRVAPTVAAPTVESPWIVAIAVMLATF